MEWQKVKEFMAVWYLRIAAFYLLQSVVTYTAACIVASRFVGAVGYVDFLHHCCHWIVRTRVS